MGISHRATHEVYNENFLRKSSMIIIEVSHYNIIADEPTIFYNKFRFPMIILNLTKDNFLLELSA